MISEYRHTTIYCDLNGPGCTGAFEASGWSFMHNRRGARAKGWRLGRDHQYCPNCRATSLKPVSTDRQEIRGL